MKIRAGFDIAYDCPQPTPMILELSVHPSRTPDLLSWDQIKFSPPLPARTYHDSFGNFCHVITAPKGRMTISTDFLIQDSGKVDPIVLDAKQHAAFTGAPVRIAPRAGAAFAAFGGALTGRILQLVSRGGCSGRRGVRANSGGASCTPRGC